MHYVVIAGLITVGYFGFAFFIGKFLGFNDLGQVQ